MKYITPEISWHGRDPVYSADFQCVRDTMLRLATCGADKNIRLWEVSLDADQKAKVSFLSTLNRHTRTVNVVRFSPNGQIIASGGDDSAIMLWRKNQMPPSSANIFADEEEENKESWTVFKVLRSHLEDVYDLSWSSDGLHLLSGSVDSTAILWDIKKGHKLWMFTDHKHFVQGVSFDPRGSFLATISCDRSCRIYSFKTRSCLHNITKLPPSLQSDTSPSTTKSKPRIFHDDTMKSFFRRLDFSPDGNLLVVPSGCIEGNDQNSNVFTTLVFARNNLNKPVLHLPGPSKATIVVRFNPVLYTLREINPPQSNSDSHQADCDSVFKLSYRMVFAVASEDSIYLYDTQQPRPFALLSNIHYHTLSDLSWSYDGRLLIITSTDGFCTLVSFQEGEIGEVYSDQIVQVKKQCDIDAEEKLRKEMRQDKQKNDKRKNATTEPQDHKKQPVAKTNSQTNPADVSTVASESSKPARRVQVTTLSQAEPEEKKPRRISLTTLTTCSQEDLVEDTSSGILQLELTNDAPSSPKPSSENPTPAVKTPRRIQPILISDSLQMSSPSASASNEPAMKTPRRIQPTLIESSPISSQAPAAASDQEPKKRRVQLTTLSTPHID